MSDEPEQGPGDGLGDDWHDPRDVHDSFIFVIRDVNGDGRQDHRDFEETVWDILGDGDRSSIDRDWDVAHQTNSDAAYVFTDNQSGNSGNGYYDHSDGLGYLDM